MLFIRQLDMDETDIHFMQGCVEVQHLENAPNFAAFVVVLNGSDI